MDPTTRGRHGAALSALPRLLVVLTPDGLLFEVLGIELRDLGVFVGPVRRCCTVSPN